MVLELGGLVSGEGDDNCCCSSSSFSFAHPGTYRPTFFTTSSSSVAKAEYRSQASYFWQRYGNLEFLDHYFETMFYPRDRKVEADEDELSWNRSDLFVEIHKKTYPCYPRVS